MKVAVVDITAGKIVSQYVRTPTPPSGPATVGVKVKELAEQFAWKGPIGCTLPGYIVNGKLTNAPNLHKDWGALNITEVLQEKSGHKMSFVNDVDAIGLAELYYGKYRKNDGITIILAFGTGIGSALLYDDILIEGTELGEIIGPDGAVFEKVAAARNITSEKLSIKQWGQRAQPFFNQIELLLNPRRWLMAGGLVAHFPRFFGKIKLIAPVRGVCHGPKAGIIGAAVNSPSPQ